ncbi:integrase [Caulobacter sp. Root656]|nr:integrase [Caulobacter sp. Root656]
MRACQLLLGHWKLESTVRYRGIEVDDAREMSEAIDL